MDAVKFPAFPAPVVRCHGVDDSLLGTESRGRKEPEEQILRGVKDTCQLQSRSYTHFSPTSQCMPARVPYINPVGTCRLLDCECQFVS